MTNQVIYVGIQISKLGNMWCFI